MAHTRRGPSSAADPAELASWRQAQAGLAETEAMLWAGGMVLPREEIGRDALDALAASDPEAMRLARWALRRLAGQGALTDLPGFLGLHRRTGETAGAARLRGPDFARGAAEYLARRAAGRALHPLVQGCLAGLLWRQAGLSPPDRVIEPAVPAARLMAQGCERLSFAPLGPAGRRIEAWAAEARRATAAIRGENAGRVIAVLAARPLASAEDVAAAAGISRMTAERMLNRMTGMGVIREITGASRFRLWRANPAAA